MMRFRVYSSSSTSFAAVLDVAIATKHGAVGNNMLDLFQDQDRNVKAQRRSGTLLVRGFVADLLSDSISDSDYVPDAGFAVVVAASTGNEVLKELFMELQVLSRESKITIQALYNAIRVILAPDDNRVVASQVYGYARTFAKLGIARALTEALQAGIGSDSLDEICKSIAETGVIDTLLRSIDDSGEQGNKTAAKTPCSLLSTGEVKRGLDKLIKVAQRFSEDPLRGKLKPKPKLKLIRTAKANSEICRASATDALRDLGLDNYNS